MEQGYIRFPRWVFEHYWWRARRVFENTEAVMDLYQSARFRDGCVWHCRGKTIVLKRGELVASQRFLAERWRWSRGRVERFLNVLCNENKIEMRQDQGESVISICDYGTYDISEATDKAGDSTTDKAGDSTTDKAKLEKSKKVNKVKGYSPEIEERHRIAVGWFFKSRPRWPRDERECRKAVGPLGRASAEEFRLMGWFYGLPKSENYDWTWKRKGSIESLFLNWDVQLEMARDLDQNRAEIKAPPGSGLSEEEKIARADARKRRGDA